MVRTENLVLVVSDMTRERKIHRISRASVVLVGCAALEADTEYGRLVNKNHKPSGWTNYDSTTYVCASALARIISRLALAPLQSPEVVA